MGQISNDLTVSVRILRKASMTILNSSGVPPQYETALHQFCRGQAISHRYLVARSTYIRDTQGVEHKFVELCAKSKGSGAVLPIAITTGSFLIEDYTKGLVTTVEPTASSSVLMYNIPFSNATAQKYKQWLTTYLDGIHTNQTRLTGKYRSNQDRTYIKPRLAATAACTSEARKNAAYIAEYDRDHVHKILTHNPYFLLTLGMEEIAGEVLADASLAGTVVPNTSDVESGLGFDITNKEAWSVPKLDANELSAAKDAAEYKIALTDYGDKVFNLCLSLEGSPIYMEGEAGAGKTFMGHMLGEHTGRDNINSITFTSRIDQEVLVGTPRPTPFWRQADGTVIGKTGLGQDMSSYEYLGIGLGWQDGTVTKMVRASGEGGMLILDELPKAPPEFNNRLHSLMEDGYRHFTVYENSEDEIPVHPKLWIYATGNPTGGGYFNNPLDKALLDRMRIIQIKDEIADEPVILNGILPEQYFGKTANKLRQMAVDMREDITTTISTRSLIMTAKTLLRGVDITTALIVCHVNTLKETEQKERAMSVFATHFEKDYEEVEGLEGVNL